jgi:hypothetical protein
VDQRVQGSKACTLTNDISYLARQPNGKAGAVCEFGRKFGHNRKRWGNLTRPRPSRVLMDRFSPVVNHAEAHPHHFTSVTLSAYVE